MKLKDILSGKINEVRMTPARVQKIQRNLQKAIEALKVNFPKYKAAKESGDEKKLKKHTKIALDLTKKKKELEKDLDKALGGLYADAELQLEASYDQLQFINKTTSKDITKHLMDYLAGKIDKREFTKLSGLNLGFKNQVKLSEVKLNENKKYKKGQAVQYQLDRGSPKALKPSVGTISKIKKVGTSFQYTIQDGGPVPVWGAEIIGLAEGNLNEANNMYDDVLTLKRSFDIFKQQSPDLYKQLDAKFKVKNIQKTLGDMQKFMDTPEAFR